VQPTLNRLAAQTRESFSVVVLDGDEVVIVARSASVGSGQRLMAYGLHLGARLPAHATSTGRVLLAAHAAARFRPGSRGVSCRG
jgi:IclR family transcriptional regulator, pca regulon regulatory protein